MMMATIDVFGMRMDMVQIADAVSSVERWIISPGSGQYIAVCNAYDAVMCRRHADVRTAVNAARMVVPDGISMVMLGRVYGHRLKRRVYGPDLMRALLEAGITKKWRHFFYGTTDETLARLVKNLSERFPGLQVAGVYAPPFRPLTSEEDAHVGDVIARSGAHIVWVGLGTPKQQIWMYEHHKTLRVPVLVGVGAAFDFFAGTKKQAPRWMRDHGFEWLFRLLSEPGRLWKRYLVCGVQFVWYAGLQVFRDFFRLRLAKTGR
jgi:N-acetylglucosaminyldiphosphoundecaprenol N-acetyl-beta-D-mannosaminyltransferase